MDSIVDRVRITGPPPLRSVTHNYRPYTRSPASLWTLFGHHRSLSITAARWILGSRGYVGVSACVVVSSLLYGTDPGPIRRPARAASSRPTRSLVKASTLRRRGLVAAPLAAGQQRIRSASIHRLRGTQTCSPPPPPPPPTLRKGTRDPIREHTHVGSSCSSTSGAVRRFPSAAGGAATAG